ncbi:MAG: hypothetical protein KGM44_04545 [bacterium]|nr:hypothetical protein [bacterium]
MTGPFRALLGDERGAALPEYALVLALLTLMSVTALAAIALQANNALSASYSGWSSLQESPPP